MCLGGAVGDEPLLVQLDGPRVSWQFICRFTPLVWSYDHEEECGYILVSKMRGLDGQCLDQLFKGIRLVPESTTVLDCAKELTITDQGYAITHARRARRALGSVGLVTTNQLSSQLLAVEGAVQTSLNLLLIQAIQALCDRTNALALSVQAALRVDATRTMRSILNRSDIMATHLGDGYVQVRRCVSLPPASVQFLAFNDTCFTLPQIEVVLPSGSRWRSFIDPNTNIVVKHAARIDCEISQPVVVHHQDVWQEFDPQKGTFSPLLAQNIQTVSSFSDPSSLLSPPRLTIFHNLVLTNLSELTERDQLQELWLSMDHSRLSKYVSSVLAPHQVSSQHSGEFFVGAPIVGADISGRAIPYHGWVLTDLEDIADVTCGQTAPVV
ncbi:unnamed protein product [Heligmosomoides polygyrus]|uniref:Major capsid protein n=1 Tax=Heligmosomoides polygyrus TaxID=6339 RepID=A0A183GUZ0_HELPZ|nr:unnamed protein product [Heligmosomoides polygyrus]